MMPIIYCVIMLAIISSPIVGNVAKLPNCGDKNQRWVLVNTLDGKLSVLDYNDSGKEIWNIQTGPGAMLSSNIDRLELTNNGHWVRIIPSLTGSLYKFNGDTIDAIPITADNLLTASFKYLDDLVIAGGKEVRTYGVVLHSGKLLYECNIHGCQNKTDYDNYEDILLLERNTQTVRAVEPRSGVERWNFSVGQVDLKLPHISCHSDTTYENSNFNLKAVVPEGLVYAFGNSNQILWKKKFTSPVVNIWTWNGQTFNSVDLFSDIQYAWSLNTNMSPTLYVGMHNKQLYIHESVTLQKFLSTNNKKVRNQLTEIRSVSQIPWKPFPAKSSVLAIVDPDKATDSDDVEPQSQISTTALSVLYASEYVNGNGYYLYNADVSEENLLCDNNITIDVNDDNSDTEDDTPVQVIIVSLWYWWKEVMVIAITTALVFNVINQHFFNKIRSRSVIKMTEDTQNLNKTCLDAPLQVKRYSESSDKEFNSRYLDDFDTLHCLGRGGFGIVFEARNKIDECSYAVKRITLPNKPESRERVMREVKALAKLDNRNIVRYFNAWLESPPPEWIDEFDRIWKQDIYTESIGSTTFTKSPIKKLDSAVIIDFSRSDIKKDYSLADLKSPETMSTDSYIVFENSCKNNSNTSTEIETDKSTSSLVTKHNSEELNKSSRSAYALNIPGKVFLYIQMQLCRKESLRDWLKENIDRSNCKIKSIFEQIVSAVEYVHLKGLIHRDLKPSNIFFSIEGEIKVGDFGLVTGMEECTGNNEELESDLNSLEKHTKAVGTQLYMSPEQLYGLSYNYKVDIYSLGVILFELLVSFHTAMERIKTLSDLRKNKFPKQFCQKFPKEHALLKLMLSECPEQRPTTFGIRARPPLSDTADNCDSNYHFELPPRH